MLKTHLAVELLLRFEKLRDGERKKIRIREYQNRNYPDIIKEGIKLIISALSWYFFSVFNLEKIISTGYLAPTRQEFYIN